MSMGAFVTAADLTQAHAAAPRAGAGGEREAEALRCADHGHRRSRRRRASPTFDPNSPPNFPVQTMPFDVTGNPAMSIPTGFSASGLPLSMQIVGRAFDEPTVLGIGAAFEAATNLHVRRPSFDVAKAA